MNRYSINNRLAYIGGGVQSLGGMWPSVAAGDWWDIAGETCVAAYQPKGAASLAASYSNLANPGTYDAAPGVAPTWASGTGWTFNGTTQYLTTSSLVPSGAGWTLIIRFASANPGTAFKVLAGTRNPRLYIGFNTTTSANVYGYGSGSVVSSNADTSGVLAVTSVAGYRAGSQDVLTGGSWTGTPPAIEIARDAGNTSVYLSVNIQAMAVYSTTLDASQISSLTTAMNAL